MRIVGIDVAKEKVDAAILSEEEHRTFMNSEPDRQEMLTWLQEKEIDVAVMEASGGYERQWAKLLHEGGIEVRVVNPTRVRNYARAAGRHAKNDRLDAEAIAAFGQAFDEPGQEFDEGVDDLEQLVNGQMRLKMLCVRLGNWQEHDAPAELRAVYQALEALLRDQLKRLTKVIASRIEHTERFAERARIIESVPGLGEGTAASLIALLPELGVASNKTIAALAGVAPYDNQSGSHNGPRSIAGGRRKVRNALFMPTLGAATQHNPVLKAYYNRLISTGKPPKAALIACMRKLIVILNTMIARGETWDPTKHKLH
jgi:transposase